MAAMAQTFDICIRGAGIVGRTLALLLARERLKVALVPAPAPASKAAADVRAYALNTASRQLLESLRSWPDAEHATAVRQMQVQGDQGGAVVFDAEPQGVDALAWIVDVPALEARLAEAVRFQPQVEVVDAPVAAPLTVVCEGRASSTRAEFGARFEVTPYAQHAIATRLRCEHPHGQVARQWFLPDGILAFLPLDGAEGNSVAVVWSVPQEQVASLMALPPDAFTEALQTASQQALGTLTLCADRATWPLQLPRQTAGVAAHPLPGPAPAAWAVGYWQAMQPTTCIPWRGKGSTWGWPMCRPWPRCCVRATTGAAWPTCACCGAMNASARRPWLPWVWPRTDCSSCLHARKPRGRRCATGA